MQMINNNQKGITLVALGITILVLFILGGIALNYSLRDVDEIVNKKLESQLTIVQQAVVQKYSALKSTGKLGVEAPEISDNASITANTEINRPKGLVGTRIADTTYIAQEGFADVDLLMEYSANVSDRKFEEYYYLLDEDDLSELGVKKGKRDDNIIISYIVNYSTGEVFDVGNKKYRQVGEDDDPEEIYLQPTNVTINTKQYDFNDD